MAQMVKYLPTMQETLIRSMGQEDSLENEMVTHYRILAWKIPWKEEPGSLQSMGLQRAGQDWVTALSFFVPLGLTDLIPLQSKRLSRVLSSTTIRNHKFFGTQSSLWSNSHIYTWLLEKAVLTIQIFVGKMMSLLFQMLSRFVISFK